MPEPAAGTPPHDAGRAGLDELIEQFAAAEERLSSCAAGDDALLGAARIALGALYATRHLHGGKAERDKRDGVRLLRAARASKHLNADSDPNAMALLAVLLVPPEASAQRVESMDALQAVSAIVGQLLSGGPAVSDLREMRDVLDEIVAARPDDPRIGPLVKSAETLRQSLGVVQDVMGGVEVPDERLKHLASGLDFDPGGPLGRLLNALLTVAPEFGAAPMPQAGAPAPGQVGTFLDKLGAFLELSVPGTFTGAELPRLFDRLEAGAASREDERAPAAAALLRLTQAVRTNDPAGLDTTVRKLRDMAENPASAEMAWFARAIFPAVLSAASMAHGNQQDDAKAAEQLGLEWSSLAPDGAAPSMDEPGIVGLSIALRALGHHLDLAGARDHRDEAAIEEKIRALADAERATDPSSQWYFLILLQLALAELSLGTWRQDADLLERAKDRLRAVFTGKAPAAVRPLMEAARPAADMLSAVLERRADSLDEAIARARASLESASAAHDQHSYTRLLIAHALEARSALTGGPATSSAAQQIIDELEQARRSLTENSGSAVTNEILWRLAEAYRLRDAALADATGRDDGHDDTGHQDDGRAVTLALESLRVVAADVLLQLGTEHGLHAAKVGAGRGLRAAGWALAAGRAEDAVECLEWGRALVLRAAATARTVPDRLRTAGAQELAARWEQAGASPRRPGAELSEDFISLPSDLRRRALAVLRESGDLIAVPDVAHLARGLEQAGLDALVYLLPETDSAGRAVLVFPDGRVCDVPLPGLCGAGRAPFDRHLANAARRFARLRGDGGASRDLEAVERWEDSLDELCDWAGSAVVGTLIDRLAVDPTPEVPARVVIVPCGTLGLVPWHAATLSREPAGVGMTRPVRACDLLVISYAASAGELLRSLDRRREPYDSDPVVVADPSRTLHYAGLEAGAIKDTYLGNARLLGFVAGREVEAPGTPQEVLALLTGRESAAPASMLQITAHGTAGSGPTTSRLFLAAQGDADASHYVTVPEILDDSRPTATERCASLVVLDCCETDMSSTDHDEALTLTTAFVARGVADAVGSRWSIDDWSSAVCIVVFHHFLAAEKLSPAEALRAAQRWMLGPDRAPIPGLKGDLAQPPARSLPLESVSAWAAFIHQGNARPMKA